MIKWTLQKIVGSKNQRELKRMQPLVERINELEEAYQRESEEQLLSRVKDWQKHLHRYLPLQLPTKRQLETMDNESILAAATHVQERFDALRDEFPNLPTRIKTREDINDAKTAFNKIDEEFPDLRDKYLDNILPEAMPL